MRQRAARRRFGAAAAAAAVTVCTLGCGAPAPPQGPTAATAHLAAETFSTVPPRPVDPLPAPAVRAVTAAELGETWRPGCPVGPQELRRLDMNFVGPDGTIRRGSMVVHRDVADDVVEIFAELERLRYPIAKMQTVDRYRGAEDELSMRDNNTSAFNCRPLPGSSAWSKHAYGRAIDINPLVNPYITRAGDLEPATAGDYLDRTRDIPGMLHAGSPAVRVFTDRGWRWGGDWRDPVDYQHFEIG
jgi:hypothetical protein